MSRAPVLPGIFDSPTTVEVNRMRDESLIRIETTVEDNRPGFTDQACEFVLGYLRRFGPASGEVLSVKCKEAGIVPHDDRAFGPVYMRLSRRGLIEKFGTARRERGHGTSGGNVWIAVTR